MHVAYKKCFNIECLINMLGYQYEMVDMDTSNVAMNKNQSDDQTKQVVEIQNQGNQKSTIPLPTPRQFRHTTKQCQDVETALLKPMTSTHLVKMEKEPNNISKLLDFCQQFLSALYNKDIDAMQKHMCCYILHLLYVICRRLTTRLVRDRRVID